MRQLGSPREPIGEERSPDRLPTPQGRTILDSSTVRPVQVLPGLWTPLETTQRQPKMPLVRQQTQDWRARVPPMPHFPWEEVPTHILRCANCEGDHRASDKTCPVITRLRDRRPIPTTMTATELASPETFQYDETMTDAIQPQHYDGTDKDIPTPTPAENPWRTSRRRRRRG